MRPARRRQFLPACARELVDIPEHGEGGGPAARPLAAQSHAAPCRGADLDAVFLAASTTQVVAWCQRDRAYACTYAVRLARALGDQADASIGALCSQEIFRGEVADAADL